MDIIELNRIIMSETERLASCMISHIESGIIIIERVPEIARASVIRIAEMYGYSTADGRNGSIIVSECAPYDLLARFM